MQQAIPLDQSNRELDVYSKKLQYLTDEEKQKSEVDPEFADNQGDRWGFVAVLPDTVCYPHQS